MNSLSITRLAKFEKLNNKKNFSWYQQSFRHRKVVLMKRYFAFMLLIITLVTGCIFSMNDHYNKGVSNNGSQTGSGDYTVSGVIIDNSGKGISEITVALIGESTLSTMTNESGEYTFENVTNGSFIVTPPQNKYAPMPISVENKDVFVGTIKSGGHGSNKNGDYSCAVCH